MPDLRQAYACAYGVALAFAWPWLRTCWLLMNMKLKANDCEKKDTSNFLDPCLLTSLWWTGIRIRRNSTRRHIAHIHIHRISRVFTRSNPSLNAEKLPIHSRQNKQSCRPCWLFPQLCYANEMTSWNSFTPSAVILLAIRAYQESQFSVSLRRAGRARRMFGVARGGGGGEAGGTCPPHILGAPRCPHKKSCIIYIF